MSRPFDFDDAPKRQAMIRQHNRCAQCGTSLINQYDHAHHVVPNQAGKAANPDHAWLRGADNCVILCEPCHERVHENGHYRNGAVAPPDYYAFSHGRRNTDAHQTWAKQLDGLTRKLYGR